VKTITQVKLSSRQDHFLAEKSRSYEMRANKSQIIARHNTPLSTEILTDDHFSLSDYNSNLLRPISVGLKVTSMSHSII